MGEVTERTLAVMARYLETGPIVLGEWHDTGYARRAILQLMERGVVKYLSLEAPIGPENMTKSDGQLVDKDKYFGGLRFMSNNEVSFDYLVGRALSDRIPVYFHDMPLQKSGLNFLANQDNLDAYPAYASVFLPVLPSGVQMTRLPSRDSEAANWYVQRNFYAANYLKAKLGNGVRVLFGLVVLAGSSHVQAAECKKNPSYTIQGCLGISPARAFVCT
jgi:hypothetical protein